MKVFKRIIIFLLIAVLLIGGVVALNGYKMYQDTLKEKTVAQKIEEIKSDKNYVTIDKIPKDFLNAVVAVEDHRFKEHGGIDIIGIGRAIIYNIRTLSLSQGGSTITQQLAKNIFFTQEREFTRKIAEIFMAFDLEKKYSKDEILELYVNTNYFGDGYYGIREASKGYYKKEPSELTAYESTLLAGVPNAPSVYSPTANMDLARKRQRKVLDSMVSYGYLTQQEADTIYNSK